MRPKFARLTEIEHEHPISRESDTAFWRELQRALLLVLRERGTLTEGQTELALEILRGDGKE